MQREGAQGPQPLKTKVLVVAELNASLKGFTWTSYRYSEEVKVLCLCTLERSSNGLTSAQVQHFGLAILNG